MMIDQVAELIAVLIQMEDYDVLRWGIGDFSDVLISRYFKDLSVLDSFSLGFYFGHSVSVKLFGELIIFVKLVFHFLEFGLIFAENNVLYFVLLGMLLLHLFLLFVESGFFIESNVITVLDLDIEPLCGDFVGHLFWG